VGLHCAGVGLEMQRGMYTTVWFAERRRTRWRVEIVNGTERDGWDMSDVKCLSQLDQY
jgi:hypothetical protein